MLPNKWQRIAIAAAGMYVELILASICTFLWWFSQPGLFNSLCLNTMLVCSVGTLVLNGNPLLRYDGYFILSDLVEVPNLKAESTGTLRRILRGGAWASRSPRAATCRAAGKACLRSTRGVDRLSLVRRSWCCGSECHPRPYHLELLVVLVAGVTLSGCSGRRCARAVGPRSFALPHGAGPAALTFILAGAAVLAVRVVPLPMAYFAPVVLEYRDAQRST
jgi:hypothetical protein